MAISLASCTRCVYWLRKFRCAGGFQVLLTPRTPIDVNWEVLDLLKMAGRQAASYFARMQVTDALLEARC